MFSSPFTDPLKLKFIIPFLKIHIIEGVLFQCLEMSHFVIFKDMTLRMKLTSCNIVWLTSKICPELVY